MASNQTISVYLPKDLWDKVQEAEAESGTSFKATEFCKLKLAELLGGELPSFASVSEEVSFTTPALPQDVESYDYEITFKETVTSATAYLNDVVQPQGGYPISMMTDPSGRLGFLIGWPKPSS